LTIEVDASDLASYNPELLVLLLAKKCLSWEAYQDWHNATRRRIEEEVFCEASYSKKISLNVEGSLEVHGDLILGDVINVSQEESRRQIRLKAEIGLQELAKACPASPSQPVLLILERAENLAYESCEARWLESTFLAATSPPIPLKLVVLSRESRRLSCGIDATRIVKVGPLEPEESQRILKSHGISDRPYMDFICRVTRNHALSVKLATTLGAQEDIRSLPGISLIQRFEERLITEFFLAKVIQAEKDPLVLNAIMRLPVLRVLFPENMRDLLCLEQSSIDDVINVLRTKGFIESYGPYYRFHDLLRELTLNYILYRKGQSHLADLHTHAANCYLNNTPPVGYELAYVMEPMYHLQCVSYKEALAYFEPVCKQALDRKDRQTVVALLSQVDFRGMPDDSTKGWFLLRLGGYFREFRDYEAALRVFEDVIRCAGADDKLRAYTLNNMGWVYLFHKANENAGKAIEFFQESSQVCDRLNLPQVKAMNLNNIGIAWEHRGIQYREMALHYYRESLAITETNDQYLPLVAAKSHRNIAVILAETKDLEEALSEFERARFPYQAARDIQGLGETIYLQANALMKRKR
jgi:tetratricopeptide (TPR) repeat protein